MAWHRFCVSPLVMNEDENSKSQYKPSVVAITGADFNAEVLESKQPVLVGFWSPWSQPCQVLDTVLQDVARDLGGKVKVVKVNADDSIDLSLCFDIQSVPTLLCFVNGKPWLRILGTASKEAILAKLKPFYP